jgi:hypothetical protein
MKRERNISEQFAYRKITPKKPTPPKDQNVLMLMSNVKSVKHHAEELGKQKINHVDAWVIAKSERAATDLSDIAHFIDGQSPKNMKRGGEINYNHKIKIAGSEKELALSRSFVTGLDGSKEYMFIDKEGNPFTGYGFSVKQALKGIEGYQNRDETLNEKAEQIVGSSTWHELDNMEKAEVVSELVKKDAIDLDEYTEDDEVLSDHQMKNKLINMGYSSPMIIDGNHYTEFSEMAEHFGYKRGENGWIKVFADGGIATGDKVKVVYKLKGASEEKIKIFDNDDSADLFIETMSDDEDIDYVKKAEKEKKAAPAAPAAKPNIFAAAKKAPAKASSKGDNRLNVEVAGISDDIARYNSLTAIIKNAKSEQELIGGNLKQIGKDKFLELYEASGKNPDTFNLADLTEKIMFIVMDKYKKVEPEKVSILEEAKYEGLVEEVTTFSFNPEILDRVGQLVSDMIMDSRLLSEEDKANLIIKQTSITIKKGAIDRLLQYDNPREIFDLIEPIMALK